MQIEGFLLKKYLNNTLISVEQFSVFIFVENSEKGIYIIFQLHTNK